MIHGVGHSSEPFDGCIAALAMVMTALAAGAVATSAMITTMGIAPSLTQDMDLLDYLASASPHLMLWHLCRRQPGGDHRVDTVREPDDDHGRL